MTMTDEILTEALERHAKLVMPNYPNDVCSRAKLEIERLVRDVEEARAAETRMRGYRDGLAKIGAELGQENERLRAVLEILAKDPPATLDEPDSDSDVIKKMRAIARAALDHEQSLDKGEGNG